MNTNTILRIFTKKSFGKIFINQKICEKKFFHPSYVPGQKLRSSCTMSLKYAIIANHIDWHIQTSKTKGLLLLNGIFIRYIEIKR